MFVYSLSAKLRPILSRILAIKTVNTQPAITRLMATSINRPVTTTTLAITHVIFDLDGVLLDSETRFIESIKNVLTHQFSYSLPRYVEEQIAGLWLVDSSKLIVNELQLPVTAKEYQDQVLADYLANAKTMKLMPGSERIVNYFKSINIPMAVCTGGRSTRQKHVLCHFTEFFKNFNHILTAGDDPEVRSNKPAPDPYLVCAKRFSQPPNTPGNVLVFEDSAIGAQSAVAAGMNCVFFADARMPDKNGWERPKVAMVIGSLNEFRPNVFGLPGDF